MFTVKFIVTIIDIIYAILLAQFIAESSDVLERKYIIGYTITFVIFIFNVLLMWY